MTDEPRFDAVVVAAGTGLRSGGAKQWRLLAGKPVIRWSAEAMAGARRIVVVVPEGGEAQALAALDGLVGIELITGGADRAASVRNGLQALQDHPPEFVVVHDAARPLLAIAQVEALLAAITAEDDGAILALPVVDALKLADGGVITRSVPREGLWRAQTPQAFRYQRLLAAYEAPQALSASDDAEVIEAFGGRVRLVTGDARLLKLTYPEDFEVAGRLAMEPYTTRVGLGLDAHRWGPGEGVWLCGVRIEHHRGLIGHSDADAGLHALTDAVLGAIGAGDIGDHFPPGDPQWKGQASDHFLAFAMDLLRRRGGRLINCDLTLVCEAPRIKPHRAAMCARLAEITGVEIGAISVKATTTEGMGFTGREEGLLAQAIVSVRLPA